MSFSDPLSVTVSGVTSTLPRVSTEGDETIYRSSDGLLQLDVAHQETGRNRKRHQIRITSKKLSPDPHVPSENIEVSASTYVVIDVPQDGYSATETKALVDGFITALNATSGLMFTKLIAGES